LSPKIETTSAQFTDASSFASLSAGSGAPMERHMVSAFPLIRVPLIDDDDCKIAWLP
jgi:hypothetical protein